MPCRIDRFLEEATQLTTPLNKHNPNTYRPVSKDHHVTISREVKDKMQQCYSWIRERCKDNGKRTPAFYACKASTIRRAMESIQKLKVECEKNKFHRKRCERTCNSALNYLKRDFDAARKHGLTKINPTQF